MNKTCLAAWGALITAGCLALSGCGKAPETKPATGHALPTPPYISKYAPGQFGGQLILAITNPPTFNPVLANSPAAEAVTRLLFSSLVVMDLAGDEAQPGLAESWSVDSDQRTWTFKLRKGLRWSDGEPLIADDVVFTWNSVLNDRTLNPFSYNLYRLNGTNLTVTKVDDVTVRMVTPVVFAPFLEFFRAGGPSCPSTFLPGPSPPNGMAKSIGSMRSHPRWSVADHFGLKKLFPGNPSSSSATRNSGWWTARAGDCRIWTR